MLVVSEEPNGANQKEKHILAILGLPRIVGEIILTTVVLNMVIIYKLFSD